MGVNGSNVGHKLSWIQVLDGYITRDAACRYERIIDSSFVPTRSGICGVAEAWTFCSCKLRAAIALTFILLSPLIMT